MYNKYAMIMVLFAVSILPAVQAQESGQGFTVTSVSLSNILHPGQNVSQTQWLVQLSLNGGGQSLVGTLSSRTINYQGYTSVYPLQISGTTDPEQAFYLINTASRRPIYTYSTLIENGSVSTAFLGLSVTVNPAPSCPNSPIAERDVYLVPSTLWVFSGTPQIAVRVCEYQNQVAQEATISTTPNIQFASHFSLLANNEQENLDLSYNQPSVVSQDGLVQAQWVGSLVTGTAPPDGSQYVAITSQQTNSWTTQSSYNYQNWLTAYQNLQTVLTIQHYTQNNLTATGCNIQQSTTTLYINQVANCINNYAQSTFTQNNQYAQALLGSSVNIGGSTPQLTTSQGQTAFSIPLNNYFVTNPVVLLKFSGSFVGVVIPLGKPKVLSVSSQPFTTNGNISIQVQNVGTAEGSFYLSLNNCNGIKPAHSSTNYAFQPGQIQWLNLSVSTMGLNQNITEQCSITVTDYNGGGSDTAQVGITMKHTGLANNGPSNGNQNTTSTVQTTSPVIQMIVNDVIVPAATNIIIPSICSSTGPLAGICTSGLDYLASSI